MPENQFVDLIWQALIKMRKKNSDTETVISDSYDTNDARLCQLR